MGAGAFEADPLEGVALEQIDGIYARTDLGAGFGIAARSAEDGAGIVLWGTQRSTTQVGFREDASMTSFIEDYFGPVRAARA